MSSKLKALTREVAAPQHRKVGKATGRARLSCAFALLTHSESSAAKARASESATCTAPTCHRSLLQAPQRAAPESAVSIVVMLPSKLRRGAEHHNNLSSA